MRKTLGLRGIVVFLTLILLFSQFTGISLGFAEEGVNLDTAINKTADYLLADGIGSDWEALTINAAGRSVPSGYLTQLENTVSNWNWDDYLATDLERTILGVVATGRDPQNFCGINLINKLVLDEHNLISNQGINAVIYGLLALDSDGFEVPEGAKWNRDNLIQYLIDNKTASNGWSLSGEGVDPDVTGAALVALAPYKERAEVQTTILDAVSALSSIQLPSGGFASSGIENCESSAQVILGLVAVGISPEDHSFNKTDGSLVDSFLTYALDNGAFEHIRGLGSNEAATLQALQALVALKNFDPDNSYSLFYRITSNSEEDELKNVVVRIEGIDSTITTGTTQASTALTAVENVLTAKGIVYEVDNLGWGNYIKSINSLTAASFGGYDGWIFYVKRAGQIVEPQVGIGDFQLEENDEVIVFYGEFPPTTLKLSKVTLNPANPQANQSFTIKFESQYYDYVSNGNRTVPIKQAKVNINNTVYETDDNGIINLTGLAANEYEFIITKYNEHNIPSLVKDSGKFTVSPVNEGLVQPKLRASLTVMGESTIISGSYEFNAGDNIIDLLTRALDQAGISYSLRGTGASRYVRGINGLNEFDQGPLSGWLYKINGVFPGSSANTCLVNNGDIITWVYTKNLGADVGAPQSGQLSKPPEAKLDLSDIRLKQAVETLKILPDNKLPLSNFTRTIIIENSKDMMSTGQSEVIKNLWMTNSINLQKEISTEQETIISDPRQEVNLSIPPYAVYDHLTVSVTKENTPLQGAVSPIYQFGPNGTVFYKPILIELKVPVHAVRPESLALAWFDEINQKWIPIPAQLDLKTGIIKGEVNHFTRFALVTTEVYSEQIAKTSTYLNLYQVGSEWEEFTLKIAGKNKNDSFLTTLENQIKATNGQFNLVTDLERSILAIVANGKDPRNFGGVDLIEKLVNNKYLTRQGINGVIYGLLALDSGCFETDKNAEWNRERLISYIIEHRTDSNGWSLFEEGLDPDLTGAALIALAPYQDREDVKKVISGAINALSREQLPSGGFASSGVENCESSAQVILGLTALGINPRQDIFTKEKGNLVDTFLSHALPEGGFEHIKGEGRDEMASIQGLQALIALEEYKRDGKADLYYRIVDFSSSFADLADVPWARQQIENLSRQGIISGITASRFNPQAAIKRADFVILIAKGLGLEEKEVGLSEEADFYDVPKDAYYYPYLKAAAGYNFISGYQGYFRPDDPINREEMACLAAKLLVRQGRIRLENDYSGYAWFEDRELISTWALDSVGFGVKNGVLKGKQNNLYDPKAAVTRAEAAVFLANILS